MFGGGSGQPLGRDQQYRLRQATGSRLDDAAGEDSTGEDNTGGRRPSNPVGRSRRDGRPAVVSRRPSCVVIVDRNSTRTAFGQHSAGDHHQEHRLATGEKFDGADRQPCFSLPSAVGGDSAWRRSSWVVLESVMRSLGFER
jgi:hypothetical protein